MPNFPFVVGDSLQIGTATISATGNAIVLPSGTQVGSTPVATTQEVATGGGPKITGLQVTDSAWTVLDDTAVDTAGGYFVITGTNFVTGCLVYIGQTPANSVGFVNTTTVRVTAPATAAGTYPVYLVNPDGGTAIRVPGINFSASPAWQTASSLADQYDGVLLSLSLVATDAAVYTVTSGSLPPGLSLNSNTGVISGTVTGVTVDTTYTFTVRATDAELQDSPRTFTITITTSDPYFKLTTLLLTGNSGNTIVTDSSTNNFAITVAGDSRATNFHPYHTYWSAAFNGTATNGSPQVINAPANSNYLIGTGQFSIESWVYIASSASGGNGNSMHTIISQGNNNNNTAWALQIAKSTTPTIYFGYTGSGVTVSSTYLVPMLRWFHILVTRDSSNGERIFLDGRLVNYRTNTTNYSSVSFSQIQIGTSYDTNYPSVYGGDSYGNTLNGFLSQLRVDIGGIPVEYQTTNTTVGANIFTPPTTNLTTTANTKLLTFRNYSLTDFSTINATLSRNGSTSIQRFNPFDLSDTSTNGSMYFDGTGDYLTVGSGASALNLNSDCSIELWFYPTSASSGGVLTSKYGGGTNQFFINSDTANKIYAEFLGSTYYAKTSSTSYVRYAWNHLLVTKSSTTAKMWLNGVYEGVWTVSSTNSSTNPIGIGSTSIGGSVFTGYLSNVKFSNVATETGTSNITVPNSPFTATANTQLLTLQNRQPHNNHSFQDSSSNNFLITRSGNTTQGTFSPFSQSGWSNYFGGTGNSLTTPSNAAFAIGTTGTIEGWFYFLVDSEVSGATNKRLFSQTNNSSNLDAYLTGRQVAMHAGIVSTTNANLQINIWYHIAVVYNSGILKVFIDGVEKTLSGTSTGYNITSTSALGINRLPGQSPYETTCYVSNFRLVKGTAVYTSNFTPSTTPLTAISGTSLLTCQSNRFVDNSSNNFAITVNSSPSVQAFSPFAATATYSPAIHGGSAYFDGNGDYLQMPYNTAFKYGASQNFCLEIWAYATSSVSNNYFAAQVNTNNWGFYFGIGVVTSGRVGYAVGNGATNSVQYMDDTEAFIINQWNHVVVCRTGSTLALFVNGVRKSTVTNSNALNLTTDREIRIGSYIDASGYWPGYLSNLRSVVGSNPYDATQTTLTIPTTPLTAVLGTSLLLNFTNPAIQDVTGRNILETVADARTTSAVTKWAGQTSMYFDGNDYISIPSSPLLIFNTGDFTIEAWIYHISVTGQQTYVGDTYGSTAGPYFYKDTSHKVGLYYSSQIVTGTTTIAANTWYHVAVTRASGTTRLFINGVQESSVADSTNLTVSVLYVGGDTNTSTNLNGYMQDLRITRYARYTANFTAPTAPARLK